MTPPGIERRAQRARQAPQTRSTSLMHHCTVDTLRAGFASLDGKKATGVEGGTNAMYGEHLAANRRARHQKRPTRAYRPQPGRRVERPTDDGRPRPVGICCVEDKIVQEMARRLRAAIYEPVVIDTS